MSASLQQNMMKKVANNDVVSPAGAEESTDGREAPQNANVETPTPRPARKKPSRDNIWLDLFYASVMTLMFGSIFAAYVVAIICTWGQLGYVGIQVLLDVLMFLCCIATGACICYIWYQTFRWVGHSEGWAFKEMRAWETAYRDGGSGESAGPKSCPLNDDLVADDNDGAEDGGSPDDAKPFSENKELI